MDFLSTWPTFHRTQHSFVSNCFNWNKRPVISAALNLDRYWHIVAQCPYRTSICGFVLIILWLRKCFHDLTRSDEETPISSLINALYESRNFDLSAGRSVATFAGPAVHLAHLGWLSGATNKNIRQHHIGRTLKMSFHPSSAFGLSCSFSRILLFIRNGSSPKSTNMVSWPSNLFMLIWDDRACAGGNWGGDWFPPVPTWHLERIARPEHDADFLFVLWCTPVRCWVTFS